MSEHELRFSISFPKQPKYEPFRGSFEDGEQHCLARLEAQGSVEALNYLIDHCVRHGREDRVRWKLEDLIEGTEALESRAILYVYLGQSYERTGEWEAAADAFRGALSLEPVDPWTAYFTHAKLGGCLCRVGRPTEAERYCRLAVSIDPARPEAYDHLGNCLYEQDDLAGAARAWVDATRSNAAQDRSLAKLERLVEKRPQLLDELPRLGVWLEECRGAVALANEMREKATRPQPPPSDHSHRCSACGEKAIEIQAFGPPIDECGRRRAVSICPGCGKQSLATLQEFDLDGEPVSEPEAEVEKTIVAIRPATASSSAAPMPERPRPGPFLRDLFWLSFLYLTILQLSGLLGFFFSPSEHPLSAENARFMAALTIVAMGLVTALTSVREALGRVWKACQWYWSVFLRWSPG